MSLVIGWGALKAAADLTRSLRDGLKSGQIKGDEIAGRIGEIYDYLIDSKDALLEAEDEIQRLKSELEAVSNDREFRERLTFSVEGFYFRRDPSGQQERYCSSCLDESGKRIRLTFEGTRCHIHGVRR